MKPNNYIFINLKKDVFQKVALRIKHNADSLRNIKRFPRTGIEGWFKVEIVAALGKTIRSINNKGPDITLEDGSDEGMKIEIKAATDFNPTWCFIDPIRKYGCPSLFLNSVQVSNSFPLSIALGIIYARERYIFNINIKSSFFSGLKSVPLKSILVATIARLTKSFSLFVSFIL